MDKEIVNLINANEKLIFSIISKYQNHYDKEDLYQVAVIGMIKAYRNYNTSFTCKFTSYAYSYILGEVYKYVNDTCNFKLNRNCLQLGKQIKKARDVLTQKLMREPTNYELALFLEVDEAVINEIIIANNQIDSLDKAIKEDGKTLYLSDLIASNKDEYNVDYLLLYEEIDKLPLLERKLLMGRYFEDKTQQELANILGLNQVQVSRNEKKILKKLNTNLKSIA